MISGIIFTLIVGLFFLVGIVLLKNSKNKNILSLITISMAFVVMLGVIFLDLIPEVIEHKNIFLIIPFVIGFSLLIILDLLIPHHHHEHSDKHCDKSDHEKHLNHIGIVTIIALIIHNIIEGISLYSVTVNDLKSGLLMMIGILLHNIPLGFQIGNTIQLNKNKLLVSLLCLSSCLGAIIMILFGGLSESVISLLISLTLGMLLYILIFELFNEVRKNFDKKETLLGMVLGIILLLITNLV